MRDFGATALWLLFVAKPVVADCFLQVSALGEHAHHEAEIFERLWPQVASDLSRAFKVRVVHHQQIGASEMTADLFESQAKDVLKRAIREAPYEYDWQLSKADNQKMERRHYTSYVRWRRPLTHDENVVADQLLRHVQNIFHSKKYWEERLKVLTAIRASVYSERRAIHGRSTAVRDEIRQREAEINPQIEFILKQMIQQHPFSLDASTLEIVGNDLSEADKTRIKAAGYYVQLILPRLKRWAYRLNRGGIPSSFGPDFGMGFRHVRRSTAERVRTLSIEAGSPSEPNDAFSIPDRSPAGPDVSLSVTREIERAALRAFDIAGVMPLGSMASLWVLKNIGAVPGVVSAGKASVEEGIRALTDQIEHPNLLKTAALSLAHLTPRTGNPADFVDVAELFIESLEPGDRQRLVDWLTESGSTRGVITDALSPILARYAVALDAQPGRRLYPEGTRAWPRTFRAPLLNDFMMARLAANVSVAGRDRLSKTKILQRLREFFETNWVDLETMRSLHLSLLSGVDQIKSRMSLDQRSVFETENLAIRQRIAEFFGDQKVEGPRSRVGAARRSQRHLSR